MSEPGPAGEHWDVVVKPRLMPRLAYAGAVLVVLIGLAIALTSKGNATGPALRTADQWAFLLIAVVFAGVILLLTRPRLRIGPAGLGVRNVLEERIIPWGEIVDISFPKRWARVELAGYEYVPVVAVQSIDAERAVVAMDTMRELMGRYRG